MEERTGELRGEEGLSRGEQERAQERRMGSGRQAEAEAAEVGANASECGVDSLTRGATEE